MDDQILELGPEGLGLVVVDEVPVLAAPRRDGVDHPVDDLLERPLPLRRAEGAPEVLLGQDVGGVQAPPGRNLHAELLEGHRTGGVMGDPGVPPFPVDGGIGVLPRCGELPVDADAHALRGDSHAPRTS